jgi:hypothetical protein
MTSRILSEMTWRFGESIKPGYSGAAAHIVDELRCTEALAENLSIVRANSSLSNDGTNNHDHKSDCY